ncbi:MAG: hypothetical protein KDI83_08100 [Gammaproteobacteria bacterium]|nr:hypothetical protein [Gammaproteobacteria bacterium]
MPILIDDVIVEVTERSGTDAPEQQLTADTAELDILEKLVLLQERQHRLRID